MTTAEDWGSLLTRADADQEFARLAVGASITFALAEPERTLAIIRAGDDAPADPVFQVVLQPEDWESLLRDRPSPGAQHLLAFLAPRGRGTISGDQTAFAQHLHLVRRAIELTADRATTSAPPPDLARITGRYVRVHVEPWGLCDVYVESAGSGDRSMVLLHTAGADSSQYHGLLSMAEGFPGYQLHAFDLPWHGRSGPAHGRGPLDYSLTSESYADCIAAVIAALNVEDRPVLVGASMAGAAVVEVAARHPQSIRAAVGCQAGPRVANRHNAWLRSPSVNQAVFVPEWTYGLMSPQSPKEFRDRVWWGYSQGGYAVYERDITYYTQCWDIDNLAHMLDAQTPLVVLMSGAYDYTVPPSATKELAARIPGSLFRDMPELGHFPHAENPSVFADHLRWALAEIDARC
ncbi:MAG: alpha/beta hydrolase [Microbacterium sp.]